MTGKYEYKNGTNFSHGDMREEIWAETYPMLLRKAGYQTAFAGKFGFNIGDGKEGRGRLPEGDFDRWGGGPGQTHYETAKNKSMAKYAKEYPHSTLSYGAFSRDFIKDASQSEALFVCQSASKRRTVQLPRIRSLTMFMPDKRLRNQAITAGSFQSTSRFKASKDANTSALRNGDTATGMTK